MTELFDVNTDINTDSNNENTANTSNNVNNTMPTQYHCDCGCNLDFIDYEPGFDVYVGNNWILTANSMLNYSWKDYIWMHEFKVWNELREDIILNYNHALINLPIKTEDAPWIHLYNREVMMGNNIPLNEKLYYEYVF